MAQSTRPKHRGRPPFPTIPMHPASVLFPVLLGLVLVVRLWLAVRQTRHVSAHRDRVPAPFADTTPLATHRKAADYAVSRARFGLLHAAAGAVAAGLLTIAGGIDLAGAVAARLLDAGIGRDTTQIMLVAGFLSIVDLPLDYYRQFGIEARFGFNRSTRALFFADLAKQLVLGLILAAPLAAAIVWLMTAGGAHWWLAAWGVWMAFNLALFVAYPAWIAPFFNRFSPLDPGELRARLEALLQRCEFKARGLFIMDGSRRSSHGNAYFTGLGAARRIVLVDMLLETLDPVEIEAVLAHELGHFKRKHVLQRLLLMAAGSLVLLYGLGVATATPAFYSALGVGTPSAGAAASLYLVCLPFVLFFLHPLASLWSCRHEFEADAYASRHVAANHLRNALVKLYRDNATTLTPDPLHSAFFDSHPPPLVRMARLDALAHN